MKKVCIFFAIISLFSCRNGNRAIDEIKEMTGRKIVFVEGYESLCTDNSLSVSAIISEEIKIISFIEDFPCTACTMNMLTDWIEFVNSLEEKVGFLIVINTKKREEMIDALKEHNISLPIMYYESDVFREFNKLDVLARNKTFLLNKKNEIVVVGEPFRNKKLKELYVKAIKDLKTHN